MTARKHGPSRMPVVSPADGSADADNHVDRIERSRLLTDEQNASSEAHVDSDGNVKIHTIAVERATNNVDEANIELAQRMTYSELCLTFLGFGVRCFGSIPAEIAMQTDEFIGKRQWITTQSFNRVLALYAAIPGPEATQIACYFGFLAAGRLGAVLAGVCFVLPGFLFMLLSSAFYIYVGTSNAHFQASFTSLQIAVAALFIRAVCKLFLSTTTHEEHSAISSDTTIRYDWALIVISILAATGSMLHVSFVIILSCSGLLNAVVHLSQPKHRYIGLAVIATLTGLLVILFETVIDVKAVQNVIAGMSLADSLSYVNLFVLGLLGGSLSFGSTMSAIPIMQGQSAEWLPSAVLLDGIAVASILPAPLAVVSTFIGYYGGHLLALRSGWVQGNVPIELAGAVLTTLGMFLPAISLPSLFHHQLDHLLSIKWLQSVFDGISVAVVGMMLQSAVKMIRTVVLMADNQAIRLAIFACTLAMLFVTSHKYTPIAIVVTTGLLGQLVFFHAQ